MTRRDYQLLTDVLKEIPIYRKDAELIGIDPFVRLTDELADALAQDNKAFDKDKFINDIRGL